LRKSKIGKKGLGVIKMIYPESRRDPMELEGGKYQNINWLLENILVKEET